MATRTLIARIHLVDGFGNRSRLDLREGANAELLADLASMRGVPEALSNMQLKDPLPGFWRGYAATLARVEDAIARSVRTVTSIERSPAIERQCPTCADLPADSPHRDACPDCDGLGRILA